jgi:MFS family permease
MHIAASVKTAPAVPRPAGVRRLMWALFAAQSLGSTGLLAAATVNAIAGRALTGGAGWATVPEAIYHLAAAGAALGWGLAVGRLGWRRSLVLGLALGGLGALLAALALGVGSLGVFVAGLGLVGVASAGLRLARFAAAALHPPEARGRAIANIVAGGAVAAFLWAGLSRVLGPAARPLGLAELAWPYLASLVLFIAAALVVLGGLRPEPRGLSAAPLDHGRPALASALPLGRILLRPEVALAVAAMVLGQMVMVAIMVITPLHMRGHAHGLDAIAQVTAAHVFGMYAFSPLSGRLADRAGRVPVLVLGSVVLGLACLASLASPAAAPLGLGLFLLGLGWNLCFVGGSALLADHLAAPEQARVQGLNDLLMGLASAGGSLLSGAVFAAFGYAALCAAGAVAAGLLLVWVSGWGWRGTKTTKR